MQRAGGVERQPAAVAQLAAGGEAVEVEQRPVGGEGDAEVHHLVARRVELGVGGEGADGVEAAEGVLAQRLQGHRIEPPGEPLLAEGEQLAGEGVDADVDRRGEGDAAQQPVAGEGGAEGAVEGPAGGVLVGPLGAAHEAVGGAHPLVAEGERGDQPVAVEPVAVADAAEGEAGGADQVVAAADEGRHLAVDGGERRRALRRLAVEAGSPAPGRDRRQPLAPRS